MSIAPTARTVWAAGCPTPYLLYRKRVKNLNLRVRPDGTVAVSASPQVSLGQVDSFVQAHAAFIASAQARLAAAAQAAPPPPTYRTGEQLRLFGVDVPLLVTAGTPEQVVFDGTALHLTVADPENFPRKQTLVKAFWSAQCQRVFSDLLVRWLPHFAPYDIDLPQLRLRNMKSRWGSCIPSKGIITLNTKLLSAPLPCISYVVVHEYCHFIHPNHSKAFYALLATFLPDWQQFRALLNQRRSDDEHNPQNPHCN